MEGDDVGIGFGEVGNDVIYGFDYQVYVNWCGGMWMDCFVDYGVDGQVGDIVIVYYVEVNLVGISGNDIVYFFIKFGKVGGKQVGSDLMGYDGYIIG